MLPSFVNVALFCECCLLLKFCLIICPRIKLHWKMLLVQLLPWLLFARVQLLPFLCANVALLFEGWSVKLHWKMHFVQLLPYYLPQQQQRNNVHGTQSAAKKNKFVALLFAAAAKQCARHPICGKCIGGEAHHDAAGQWGGWCRICRCSKLRFYWMQSMMRALGFVHHV